MTMDYLEFDGDSHTRKANWFGMTRSDDASNSNLSILIRSTIFDIFHIIPARGGNGNADHGNSDKFFLPDGRIFNKFVP